MFIILANQRSGTHLLATLLNSHPELDVYDELFLGNRDVNLLPWKSLEELGEKEGGIVMYNHIIKHPKRWDMIKHAKIINLYRRDLRKHAISYLMMQKFNEINESVHQKRYKKVDVCFTENDIVGRLQLLVSSYSAARGLLKGCDYMDVCYEDLTEGKSIKNLSREKAKRILSFLGVEPKELTTDIVKTNRTYD